MGRPDREVVLEGIRRFESFDFSLMAELWHPDARMSGPEGWPERGPFEGRGAVEAQFRRLAADWEEQRFSEIEFLRQENGWVIVSFRWETRGGMSGAGTSAEFAGAYRVEDGLIREAHFRWTPQEALEAAGLHDQRRP